jgi:N-acetylglucosamine repressor
VLQVKTKQRSVAALESAIVQHLRLREGISRIELARLLDLAPSTIGLYVDRLIKDGFLLEGPKSHRCAGRPPIILELNPRAGHFVGVDFEARQLSATSVDFSQRTLDRHKANIQASDTPERVLNKIKTAIQRVSSHRDTLLGIGVGVPGSVDSKRGIAIHYEYIRDWHNVPLVEQLSQEFDVPIYLENNARAMALAERWFGRAKDVNNFICLGIRSGIGAGIIINGQLYRGRNNLAGEIGSWSCPRAGGETAALADTLEERASVRAILQQLTERAAAGAKTSLAVKGNQPISREAFLHAARAHDPLVMDVLQQAAQTIGWALNHFNLLLNPEQVIIAGPLADLDDLFLDPVRDALDRLMPPLHAKVPRIVASQLGEYIGALGAAAMAVHQWKPAR